jgi:hypothetical protein
VLLHELGHTLGCVHLKDEGAFMNPFYNEKMGGFSEENGALVRLSLAVRGDDWAGVDPGLARRLREHLLGTGEAPWVSESYHAALEELEVLAQQTAPPPSAAPQRTAVATSSSINPYNVPPPAADTAVAAEPVASSPKTPDGISAEHQALFARVQKAHHAGKPREAWQQGQALFEEHPTVYAVQELRCEIAMQMGWEYGAVREHCQPMMDLARAGAR